MTPPPALPGPSFCPDHSNEVFALPVGVHARCATTGEVIVTVAAEDVQFNFFHTRDDA